jgi:hypothetical protein
MTLSATDRAELERLGLDNVKMKLGYAGPGPGAAVIGLGPGFGMTRGDVEEWVAEQTRAATKLQIDTLRWAKAAAWIGVAGIAVSAALAVLDKIWHGL